MDSVEDENRSVCAMRGSIILKFEKRTKVTEKFPENILLSVIPLNL